MTRAEVSIFTIATAPRADGQRVVLPDGSCVALAGGRTDGTWECANRYGLARLVRSFDPLLAKDTFSAEQEDKALQSLRVRSDDQEIAIYGGFIVERLYLDEAEGQLARAEIGARLGSLLTRFWEERLAAGDARAALALPMLRRSYWRALAALVGQTDALLQAAGTAHGTSGLRALVEQAGIDPRLLYLSGWIERLPGVYRRALVDWRAICLDDGAAPFFMEQLCAWKGLPTGHWQALREREMAMTVWVGRSLRPPGESTYEGRSDLRRLVAAWYLPRYDLRTAAQLLWLVGRAEGVGSAALATRLWAQGAMRLWAGAVVAYVATMLQGDTWRALIDLSIYRPVSGFVVSVGLAGFIILYLAYAVARRSGVAVWRRAGLLMLKGESGALAVGALATWLLAPSVLGQAFPPEGWPLGVILYAQLTLFIGVFSLLLDEKPVTAPFHEV